METIAEFADHYGVDLSDVWTFSNLSEFCLKGEVVLDLVRRPDDLVRICREFVVLRRSEGPLRLGDQTD